MEIKNYQVKKIYLIGVNRYFGKVNISIYDSVSDRYFTCEHEFVFYDNDLQIFRMHVAQTHDKDQMLDIAKECRKGIKRLENKFRNLLKDVFHYDYA